LSTDKSTGTEGLSSVVDRDQLERGFRRLSIDHRAVVVLHHYLDLPLDEVADALGVPVGTVRSRLHYAMRGLRSALEADARPTARRGCPMSPNRDVTSIVRSWLEEGVTTLPDRVLDTVLDQLPSTPQRRAWWPARRFREMNNPIRIALVAAVLVAVVLGFNFLPRQNVGGPISTPTPSPSPSPSASPAALPAGNGSLPAGTYVVTPFAGSELDPCPAPTGPAPSTTSTPPPAATSSTPTGYSGKYVDLQVPSDIAACQRYWPWEPGLYAQGPGHRWHLWILDVDGVRVVVNSTDYAGTSAQHRAELPSIVNSIKIQP
jgi:sigma-70-like protein